ncbi:MAG: hypothetical protein ABIL61_07105 [candidate division WOR-3 bacterium]
MKMLNFTLLIISYNLNAIGQLNFYHYKGFTPNKGQVATTEGGEAKEVIFYSRNGKMNIFITQKGLSYVIYDIEEKDSTKSKDRYLIQERKQYFAMRG